MADAKLFMHHFHDRSQTIGRARSCRYDVMPLGVIQSIVNAHHYVQRALLDGSGDYDFADAALEMQLQSLRRKEFARAFKNDLDRGLVPRYFVGSAETAVPAACAVHLEAVWLSGYRQRPAAVDAVEFEQMRGRFRRTPQLIDVNDFDLRVV